MKTELAGSSPPLNEPTNRSRSRSKRRFTVIVVIFLIAFGVRLLTWHDTRLEVGKVQYGVTADYKRIAQMMRDGGTEAFFVSTSPLANPNTLGHPPGYPMLLALTDSIYSNPRIQFLQITIDALSAVVIFLIVAELFSTGTAIVAALFAALAPQFAWNSVLLLPDTLAVFPILLAVYLLVRATKRPSLLNFMIIGALIGISCWLRANAMLLTVFFAAAAPLLLRTREAASRMLATRRKPTPADTKTSAGDPGDGGAPVWRYSLAIVGGTILLIAPLTIRNAVVFHRFIPISLGAGQTLLEGIADYDTQQSFGIPPTDVEIQQQEAESYQRPEYAKALFDPDGIERERARLSRGFAVIRSHPVWFAGVMARRASTMLRMERVPRNPRIILHAVQRVFITAVILPLAILGFLIVIFRKESAPLVLLSIVPVYYFVVQSIVHTEYRYVMAVVYFLFAFAAVGVVWIVSFFYTKVISLSLWERVR